ncbi:uncharacterized protein K452DRAFT_270397 [Aplosporella prunicola CBS 121167]|uniref:C2H2-type domain-containing protein n=1 Tax=Aplosporella prunicola CBS 121167 TaxID=1176127 RepID=A0A6A6BEM0_9PEZI|nr:uncharacterized protein K452DRAFT_270397 [Aplosporella prunicola CBS 121167]KAF2142612.1 hypothetical protein K452DRAFT_270397 [Aplosporella prunicola CBS 121167]
MPPNIQRSLIDKDHMIRAWREQNEEHPSSEGLGIIGSLFEACIVLFRLALGRARQEPAVSSNYRSLDDSFAALFFWGDGFGVARGELDTKLQQCGELREATLSLLLAIGTLLSQGLIHLVAGKLACDDMLRKSNIDSLLDQARSTIIDEEQAVDCPFENIDELSMNLETYVDCLSNLGSSLEYPATLDAGQEEAREPVSLSDRLAHQHYTELIGSRFPRAQETLLERLGKCNWDRYQRISAQRKIAALLNYEEHTGDPEDKDALSRYYDSGLGSSIPLSSLMYAETVATSISTRAEISHGKLPRRPDEAKKGMPFVCEVCYRTVLIKRTKQWKEHVFQDLRAYVCIFEGCPWLGVPFESCQAMTDHLGTHHKFAPQWTSQHCPLCCEPTPEGWSQISLHFARHMEEIALGALPPTEDSDASSDSNSTPSACPEDAQSTQFQTKNEDDPDNSGSAMQDPGPEFPRHTRSYAQSELLLIEDPFSCPGCGKHFPYGGNNLRRHIDHACPANPRSFECPYAACSKVYKRKDALLFHIGKHYDNAPDLTPGALKEQAGPASGLD